MRIGGQGGVDEIKGMRACDRHIKKKKRENNNNDDEMASPSPFYCVCGLFFSSFQ